MLLERGGAGGILWRFTAPSGDVKSSPALSPDGMIYVGSDDDRLYAVRPDGSLVWSLKTGADVRSSPALGADGVLYVGSNDGRLYAVRDDGSVPTVLWTLDLHGDVRSSPALGGAGTLYVGSDYDRLVAVGAPSAGGAAECLATVPAGCECLCDRCLPFYDHCAVDPGCTALRECAIAAHCRGAACLAPATCGGVVDATGGPHSPSAMRALAFDQCLRTECGSCLQ